MLVVVGGDEQFTPAGVWIWWNHSHPRRVFDKLSGAEGVFVCLLHLLPAQSFLFATKFAVTFDKGVAGGRWWCDFVSFTGGRIFFVGWSACRLVDASMSAIKERRDALHEWFSNIRFHGANGDGWFDLFSLPLFCTAANSRVLSRRKAVCNDERLPWWRDLLLILPKRSWRSLANH